MTSADIAPGQVWQWRTPSGELRTMLVQRITNGPGFVRRAWGINPQTGRKLQVMTSRLARGESGAELVRVIEGYEWRPTRDMR